MDVSNLIDKILQSKKYKSIYRPTIERMVQDLSQKYPEKQLEKEVKRKLHQLWGAYFNRPNFEKLYSHIEERVNNGEDVKEICKDLLLLQTSTKERLDILDDFYKGIFKVTGTPKTIIDYGCGVNMFSYPWQESITNYTGCDVDIELSDFMNRVFKLFGWTNVESRVGDIFEEKYPNADVYLLLKVVTLLEHQKKGQTLNILSKIPSKSIVVSFPMRSITGKSKGMKEFYSGSFENLVSGQNWKVEKIEFKGELVYIVSK